MKKITRYQKRFNGTNYDYHKAHEYCPLARMEEFKVLRKLAINHHSCILEFPGDGYHLDMLFPNSKLYKADLMLSGDYKYDQKLIITNYALKNISFGKFDAIIGMTPIHHATDIQVKIFFDSCYKRLKAGGSLIFGEVYKESKVAFFLDNFVDNYSINGHKGNYPDLNIEQIIAKAGFKDISLCFYNCPWRFKDYEALVRYLKLVFGLNNNIDNLFVLEQANRLLGISHHEDFLELEWKLLFVRAIKK